MAATAKAGKPNIATRIGRYVRDVRSELRRVVWPSRNEVLNSSMVVLVTLLFFIVFSLIVDQLSAFVFLDVLMRLGN